MRLLSAILSLYILLLTGIPCCAYDHCEDANVKVENNKAKHSVPQKDKENGCNSCSPFFSCHGCCGFIVAAHSGTSHTVFTFPPPAYSSYKEPYVSQFVPFFWQPPDIA
ncbi:MAG: hypothetical protein JSS96_09200 [Bacteroidetes bacterium]|nr:hypothetical protein [Bacteroidota bacterium]